MLWLLPLLLTMTAEPAPRPASPGDEAARLLSERERRVRSSIPALARMIDEGVRRSYTFAKLIRTLHESDVIVYIEPAVDLPGPVDGGIFLVPLPDGPRYLRIQVRHDLHRDEVISIIAHELRHAIEVAQAPGVRTHAAFVALYRKIGIAAPGSGRFDTAAAQETGRTVRRELGG